MQDAAVVFRVVFPLLAEKILFLRVKAVPEQVAGVEDELRVAVEFKGHRRAGERHVSGRLAPAGVKVLVPGVKRNGEKAASFTLEGSLRKPIVPNSRCAPAGSDQDNLLIELSLRFEIPSGRDFANVAVSDQLVGKA